MSLDTHHAADFFVLRSPLLPLETLERWGEGLLASQGRLDAEAVALDRATQRARLSALLERPEVAEAIRVASNGLQHGLEAWRQDPESRRGQSAEHALVRYLSRLCSRATPFGLFASTAVGAVGERTDLRIGAPRRHSRLDGAVLCELEASLVSDPELRATVPFHPNPSLYAIAGELRLIEGVQVGGRRQYRLASLEPDEALHTSLSLEPGTPGALTAALAERWPEIERDEIAGFVNTLIEQAVLVPSIGAPLTGPDPLRALAEGLAACEGAAAIRGQQLLALHAAIQGLDDGGLVPQAAALEALRRALAPLPGGLGERDLSRLIQVDMSREHAGTLGPEVVAEVEAAVRALSAVRPSRRDPDLERFIERFLTRWGSAEVPLLEAIDEESGLGFGGTGDAGSAEPLLAGLKLGAPTAQPLSITPRELGLLTRLQTAPGARVLTLEPEVADPAALPLPETYAAVGVLLAESAEAASEGRFQVLLHTTNGPSGANLLGRFCDLDPALLAAVRAHHAAEEALHPELVFAEIVHEPEGRLTNVIRRPVLRGWEIPFLGRSGAPEDRQLPLQDLKLRVEGGRLVLRSSRLGREVRPRLCSAYTVRHASSQSALRLLGALQRQGVRPYLSWSWGVLDALPFLPRVVVGRVIVEAARWILDGAQLQRLKQADPAGRMRAVAALRRELDLPRHLVLQQEDNLLPLDLESSLSVDAFLDAVRDDGQARLVERIAGPEGLVAAGVEGRYTHEFVLPFERRAPESRPVQAAPSAPRPEPVIQRVFQPGEGWLTIKLYTGPATADRVLRQVVEPLVAEARAQGWAQGWFFIRYGDPDWHLRVRFRGQGPVLCGPLLAALHAGLERHPGLVHRVVLDPYERELERYGGPRAIEAVEALFEADSDAALAALPALSPDDRWLAAAAGMSVILSRLNLDASTQMAVLDEAWQSFSREFAVSRATEHQLSTHYRAHRPRLQGLPRSLPAHAAEALDRLAGHPAWDRLQQLLLESPGLGALLAPSLLHMHANRILRAGARAQELVLYDFLRRELRSAVARRRAS